MDGYCCSNNALGGSQDLALVGASLFGLRSDEIAFAPPLMKTFRQIGSGPSPWKGWVPPTSVSLGGFVVAALTEFPGNGLTLNSRQFPGDSYSKIKTIPECRGVASGYHPGFDTRDSIVWTACVTTANTLQLNYTALAEDGSAGTQQSFTLGTNLPATSAIFACSSVKVCGFNDGVANYHAVAVVSPRADQSRTDFHFCVHDTTSGALVGSVDDSLTGARPNHPVLTCFESSDGTRTHTQFIFHGPGEVANTTETYQ